MTPPNARESRDRSLAALGFVLLIFGAIASVVGILLCFLAGSLAGLEGIRPFPPTQAEIAANSARKFNQFLVLGAVTFGGMLAAVLGIALMAMDRSKAFADSD